MQSIGNLSTEHDSNNIASFYMISYLYLKKKRQCPFNVVQRKSAQICENKPNLQIAQ